MHWVKLIWKIKVWPHIVIVRWMHQLQWANCVVGLQFQMRENKLISLFLVLFCSSISSTFSTREKTTKINPFTFSSFYLICSFFFLFFLNWNVLQLLQSMLLSPFTFASKRNNFFFSSTLLFFSCFIYFDLFVLPHRLKWICCDKIR